MSSPHSQTVSSLQTVASVQPTRLALIVFAVGLLLAVAPALLSATLWPLWLIFCGLVLTACGLDGVLCPRARDLDLETEFPRMLYMDTETPAQLRLSVPVPWPVASEATLDLSPILEPIESHRLVLSREPTTLEVRLRPRRRGRASVETLWLRYAGPLGLIRRTVRKQLGHLLEAVPNIGFLRSPGLVGINARDAFVGLKIERYSGDGTDFHALREFAPGLDTRAIDWKASARHHRLLAREFRAERNNRVVLALDTGHLMAEPVDGTPLLDHAIHAALILAQVSLRAGDRVGIFGFDARPHTFRAPHAGLASMPALLELTSRLEYSTAETNFTLGLTDLATKLNRRSLVIVLTDFVDSVTAELMIENLLRLGRRHLVLFVAFSDPLLQTQISTEPRSLHDVDVAGVADSLLREREVVIRRLDRAGILVIDDEPRRITSHLINRYLEIKRKERI